MEEIFELKEIFYSTKEDHAQASKIHLGRQVGSKFAFFRNLFAFFSRDASKLRFLSFPDGF